MVLGVTICKSSITTNTFCPYFNTKITTFVAVFTTNVLTYELPVSISFDLLVFIGTCPVTGFPGFPQAEVITPVPTVILWTIFLVATKVARTVSLALIRTGSVTWLCFI